MNAAALLTLEAVEAAAFVPFETRLDCYQHDFAPSWLTIDRAELDGLTIERRTRDGWETEHHGWGAKAIVPAPIYGAMIDGLFHRIR